MEIILMYIKVFVVGGAICTAGQLLIDLTRLTPARILVTFVVAGVVLGALNLYEPIKEFAGAGASVPITGFGASLAKGMREAIDSEGLLGLFTGGFTSCAAGICASVIFGLIASLCFPKFDKSKTLRK